MDVKLLDRLDKVRHWKMHGTPKRACFSCWTFRGRARLARVLVRRRDGESIIEMVERGLDELTRRCWQGMPKQKPQVIARQKLRAALSPSKHVN